MAIPDWVLPAIIAATTSLITMPLGRDKALRWKAWRPISIVIALDGVGGIAVLAGYQTTRQIGAVVSHSALTPSVWPAVIIGLTAPIIIRTQTPSTWRGIIGGRRLFGALRQIQQAAEREIEDISTGVETTWLRSNMIHLDTTATKDVGEWVEQYLTRTRTFPERGRKRKGRIEQIHEVLADQNASDEIKKMTIVQVLLDQEGHRAVRQLFEFGDRNVPALIVRRHNTVARFARRVAFRGHNSVDGLRADLRLPTGFKIDVLDNRVRISREDRMVDDELLGLAGRLKHELGSRALVEGVYQGWIVIRPSLGRGSRRSQARAIEVIAKQLRDCEAFGNAFVERGGTVLDEQTRLFAVAGLVVLPGNAPRFSNGYCGKAFSGAGLWLAADFGFASDMEDGHSYKRHFHATAQVPIYILFDIPNCQITRYAEPRDGAYQRRDTFRFGDEVDLPSPWNSRLILQP